MYIRRLNKPSHVNYRVILSIEKDDDDDDILTVSSNQSIPNANRGYQLP